ncbi:hypothetical protein ABIB95_005344 [Bradyrhizobium sp. LA2.1]
MKCARQEKSSPGFFMGRFLTSCPPNDFAPGPLPPELSRSGALSIPFGAAAVQPAPLPVVGSVSPGALPPKPKDKIMLSKPTLELIVSEIVAGYGKIIKRKGKLIATSSR